MKIKIAAVLFALLLPLGLAYADLGDDADSDGVGYTEPSSSQGWGSFLDRYRSSGSDGADSDSDSDSGHSGYGYGQHTESPS